MGLRGAEPPSLQLSLALIGAKGFIASREGTGPAGAYPKQQDRGDGNEKREPKKAGSSASFLLSAPTVPQRPVPTAAAGSDRAKPS